MRRLFKYTKKEYLLNLLKHGELRLGTLYEYRNYENQEIRDLEEGTGFSLHYIKDETFTNHGQNDLTPYWRKVAFVGASVRLCLITEPQPF